jgi:hypothetical protein
MVPLLRNDHGKHCYIRGNEYVPLLESRQPLAEQRIDAAIRKLVTDPNVSCATQQRMDCCVVATTIREGLTSYELLVSLRRAKAESVISYPSKSEDVVS